MGDTLKYRLPNHTVVEQSGSFKKVPFSELLTGFVVSNFNKSETFIFEEGVDATTESQITIPVCYDEKTYLEKAEQFIVEIHNRGLSKAIFSRVKSCPSTKSADAVFQDLVSAYPNAFVYFISSALFGTWIGATPEPLICCDHNNGRTVSLAGTMKASETKSWGEKEKFEQQFVSDFIQEQLRSLDLKSIEKDGPTDRVAGPVKHLETRFQFALEGKNPIEIADKLHPTPAVSGLPQGEAIKLIQEIESHDRSLYTGFIGVLGDQTNLFVNLRCAQLIDEKYYLYLGGGFTKDSVSRDEWEETENKSRTLLDILENS